MARERAPDVVVLDVKLPGPRRLRGAAADPDLLRRLRDHAHRPGRGDRPDRRPVASGRTTTWSSRSRRASSSPGCERSCAARGRPRSPARSAGRWATSSSIVRRRIGHGARDAGHPDDHRVRPPDDPRPRTGRRPQPAAAPRPRLGHGLRGRRARRRRPPREPPPQARRRCRPPALHRDRPRRRVPVQGGHLDEAAVWPAPPHTPARREPRGRGRRVRRPSSSPSAWWRPVRSRPRWVTPGPARMAWAR